MFSRRIVTSVAPRMASLAFGPRSALSPVLNNALIGSTRAFSITDMFTNFANKKINQSKDNQFQTMVDSMVNAEKWTFRAWKTMLEGQLNSWMMYIPGVGGSKDAEALKELKALLDAMTNEELDDPSLVNGAARDRIAASTGQPVEKVRSLIFMYKNTLLYHKVLKMRKSNGDAMPTSPSEMSKMFETDPRVRPIFEEVFSDSKKPRGRGRRSFR